MRLLLLTAGLTLITGCAARQIIDVQDAPAGGGTTILTTLDTQSYIFFGNTKTVYWECGEAGAGMSCEKRCDVIDDTGDRLRCNKTQIFFQ